MRKERMKAKRIYALAVAGILLGGFVSASLAASNKGHMAPLDVIDPTDEQNYGYVIIENLPHYVDRAKLIYPQLTLAGKWVNPGEKSERLQEGVYCIELKQHPFSSKFCDVRVRSKAITRYNIWEKLSLVSFDKISVPHWEDSTPFTQLKGALAGVDLRWFAKENQGKQFFFDGQSIEVEFNQFYATKTFPLKLDALNRLILDMPEIGRAFSIYQAPYGTGSRLPLINIQTDKTYYRQKYEVPSHESRLAIGWRLGGVDKIEHFPLSLEQDRTRYMNATNYRGWLFPRQDLVYLVNGIEYPIRFDERDPVNIVLNRIDVKHVSVKREDNRTSTIEGFYTIEYEKGGQWRPLYLPHYIYNGRLDEMIYYPELHNERNLEHPQGPYYQFPTQHGLDVLPGVLYRVTLRYKLDDEVKAQVFTLDYR